MSIRDLRRRLEALAERRNGNGAGLLVGWPEEGRPGVYTLTAPASVPLEPGESYTLESARSLAQAHGLTLVLVAYEEDDAARQEAPGSTKEEGAR